MSEQRSLTIGYSPCPNDTYIFYGLMHGKIPLSRIVFADPLLDDVETLNRWALEGRLDVTKLSFHALGHVLDRYCLLRAGSALGRGCGPLLVTGPQAKAGDMKKWRIAVPGEYTTAAMLLKLYQPGCTEIEVIRFEKIMDAVVNGEVDAGVIIHESRFTYEQLGLSCLQDLGEWWEETTGLPIPLGCIAAKRSLSEEVVQEIDGAIRASLEWSRTYPLECGGYIAAHAQEMEGEVVRSHIDLYVNDFSIDLGDEGVAAVEELLRRGIDAGVFQRPENDAWRLFR